jgi:hypothetical protein
MEPPKQQPELFTARMREHAERVSLNANLRKRIREDSARRAVIGNKYREELIRKGLVAAGVDYEAILKRQAKETESLLQEVYKLTAEYKTAAEPVRARHNQWSRQIFAKPFGVVRKRPPAVDAAIFGEVLKPDSATFQHTGGDGFAQVVPTGNSFFRWNWGNLIDGYVQGSSDEKFSANATFAFSWLPGSSGILGVLVPVTYNGFAASLLSPSCWNPGATNFYMQTSVSIAQDLGAETDPASVSPAPIYTDFGQAGGPYCLGEYAAEVIDNTQLFETNAPFAVFANHTVHVVVSFEIDAGTSNGGMNLDFSSEGRGITLPGVLFGLTPE